MKSNVFTKLFFLLCFVVAVSLVSCKSASVPLPTTTETTSASNIEKTIILRDTVFKTKADSSYYKAYLECVNGKVQIKGKPETKSGKNLKPPSANLDDNVLVVNCYEEAQALFARWKETYTKEMHSQATKITQPVVIEKPWTNWQKTQIWSGRLLMLLLIVAIVRFVLKITKVI